MTTGNNSNQQLPADDPLAYRTDSEPKESTADMATVRPTPSASENAAVRNPTAMILEPLECWRIINNAICDKFMVYRTISFPTGHFEIERGYDNKGDYYEEPVEIFDSTPEYNALYGQCKQVMEMAQVRQERTKPLLAWEGRIYEVSKGARIKKRFGYIIIEQQTRRKIYFPPPGDRTTGAFAVEFQPAETVGKTLEQMGQILYEQIEKPLGMACQEPESVADHWTITQWDIAWDLLLSRTPQPDDFNLPGQQGARVITKASTNTKTPEETTCIPAGTGVNIDIGNRKSIHMLAIYQKALELKKKIFANDPVEANKKIALYGYERDAELQAWAEWIRGRAEKPPCELVRCEHRMKRDWLRDRGVNTIRQAITNYKGIRDELALWRITDPNPEDDNRSRWPTSPWFEPVNRSIDPEPLKATMPDIALDTLAEQAFTNLANHTENVIKLGQSHALGLTALELQELVTKARKTALLLNAGIPKNTVNNLGRKIAKMFKRLDIHIESAIKELTIALAKALREARREDRAKRGGIVESGGDILKRPLNLPKYRHVPEPPNATEPAEGKAQ